MWIFTNPLVNLVLSTTAISIIVYVLYYFKNRSPSAFKLIVANFLTMYVIIVGSVFLYDIYLSYKLSKFDLDGDGIFSGEEITPEQDKYLNLNAHDTGRLFAPITGFIFSLFQSIAFWIVFRLVFYRFIHNQIKTIE